MNTGPVNNFFGIFLGVNTTNVGTVSAAALSPVGGFLEDTGTFPIAVDKDKVTAAGGLIFMDPDDEDTGGWTSLSPDTASASTFKGLINGSIPNPGVDVVENPIISLQNGVACSAIKEIIDHYGLIEDSTLKGVYFPDPPIRVKFPVVEVDKFNHKARVTGGMVADVVVVRDSVCSTPNLWR